LDTAASTRFRSYLSTAQNTVAKGVSPGRANSAITYWEQWITFTNELGLDPFLEAFQDKIPILQVFIQRVRDGELAANGNPIRSRSVEDYLRAVAQTFLSVGASDPRLNTASKTDFRIQRMLAAWKKQDPPATRVKPVPISVIRRIAYVAQHLPPNSHLLLAVTDMIIIAFFFLLRPGEYTDTTITDTTPFTFQDVQLSIGDKRLDLQLASEAELLHTSTSVSLTFTTQKNGIPNEVIRLGRTGDPFLCPVMAIARRILHLRRAQAPPTTPLSRVFNGATIQHVTPSSITSALRDAIKYIGFDLGFLPHEVSARSLRAGGATALLCAKVDPDIIQLLGRWRSDEMLRYLHLSAEPVMKDFAKRMLNADFRLAPNQLVPML